VVATLALAAAGGPFAFPGCGGAVPGSDPGGDGTVPGGDGTIPGGDGTIPGGDGTIPGGDGTVPGGDGIVPGGDGIAASPEERTLSRRAATLIASFDAFAGSVICASSAFACLAFRFALCESTDLGAALLAGAGGDAFSVFLEAVAVAEPPLGGSFFCFVPPGFPLFLFRGISFLAGWR
jgi:hypothetical protein